MLASGCFLSHILYEMEASGASFAFPDPFEVKDSILSAMEAIWTLLLVGSWFIIFTVYRVFPRGDPSCTAGLFLRRGLLVLFC